MENRGSSGGDGFAACLLVNEPHPILVITMHNYKHYPIRVSPTNNHATPRHTSFDVVAEKLTHSRTHARTKTVRLSAVHLIAATGKCIHIHCLLV